MTTAPKRDEVGRLGNESTPQAPLQPVSNGSVAAVVDQVLALENDRRLLDFRFASCNLLLWPFVRFDVLQHALGRSLPVAAPESFLARAHRRDLRYWRETIAGSALLLRRRFDVVFLTSSGCLVPTGKGEVFVDRLHDAFVGALPNQTLIVEHSLNNRFFRPRSVRFVRTFDGVERVAGLVARAVPIRRADTKSIDAFIHFLREQFGLDEQRVSATREHLTALAARLPTLRRLWLHFLEVASPKVVFFEDGSYGANSHLVTWTSTAGIATAEIQHGALQPTHVAYRVAPELRGSREFRAAIPQHLLVWGNWWGKQVSSSSAVSVVGNPSIPRPIMSATGDRAPPDHRRSALLFVAQGEPSSEALARVAAGLSAMESCPEMIFRPHPREHLSPTRQAQLAAIPYLSVSNSDAPHHALRSRPLVVGVSSTLLYEAAALGCRVFVLDCTKSRLETPPTFGRWFATAKELWDALRSDVGSMSELPPEELFADNWVDRYRVFLAGCGVTAT